MIEHNSAVFIEERKLERSFFSSCGKLLPVSVLSLFQEAAIDHVDAHGIGFDALIRKDLLWVVTQTRYEVTDDPAPEENVLIHTWFLTPHHGIVQREYLITDLNHKVYVKGSSYWILMNAKTRRIENRLNEVLDGEESYELSNFQKRARFIRKFESEALPVEVVTLETAIDSNGHVNNVRYAEYMTAVAKDAMDNVTAFQIDYHKEMRCGEILKLSSKVTENDTLVEGINQDEELVFLGRIKAENNRKERRQTMTRGERARSYHVPGTNCAQCILKSCSEVTELEESTAMAIGEGFGSGVRSGEICGVLSGCVMVLGLAAQKKGINNIRQETVALVEQFRSDFGCIRCEELKAKKIPCNDLIEYGGNMIEKAIDSL